MSLSMCSLHPSLCWPPTPTPSELPCCLQFAGVHVSPGRGDAGWPSRALEIALESMPSLLESYWLLRKEDHSPHPLDICRTEPHPFPLDLYSRIQQLHVCKASDRRAGAFLLSVHWESRACPGPQTHFPPFIWALTQPSPLLWPVSDHFVIDLLLEGR